MKKLKDEIMKNNYLDTKSEEVFKLQKKAKDLELRAQSLHKKYCHE